MLSPNVILMVAIVVVMVVIVSELVNPSVALK